MSAKPMSDTVALDSLAHAFALAAEVIAAVIAGRSLDAALAACAGARPAVQDLAYGALRRYGRGDFLLARLLREPLREARLRALLLATLYRLAERPDDAHTSVDQAVSAAGQIAGGRFRGLANGVLRNYLRRREELETAADADLVARHQHPRWWIEALRAAYPEDWERILAIGNARPPMTLRVNRRRADAAACLAALDAAGIGARMLDSDAILLDRPRPVAKLPGFAEGHFSVQDWSAQQAVPLLDVQDGMRVLDACAAPGGKSAHLLEIADLDLLALDAAPGRAALIGDNLARLGLHAQIATADCRAVDSWWDGRPFDRILADVPCSASGVVRRHPDIKWLRRETDIAGFTSLQAGIIDALWRVLAANGKMLYCTCTMFPQENALQLAAFASRHGDVVRQPISKRNGSLDFQLMPHAEHDGFYYALLQKRS